MAPQSFTIPPHGATPEGTKKFFTDRSKNIHSDKIRSLHDFAVSAMALGTYLGNYDDETDRHYEEAVGYSISRGVNFIDTAINYRCQRSERSIGRALADLIRRKEVTRNEIVISTKGGFVPFDSRPAGSMQEYLKKHWFDPGLITPDDVVSSCHCMHPQFLQKMIDDSLSNLQLDTIDIYYLHNPEMQLAVLGADLFYSRLKEAFRLFEENADRGKIQYYGLATWTGFREPIPDSISLDRVIRTAQSVGGENHRFKAIQLPYNLAMLEAVSIHNQSVGNKPYPIIPAASFQQISVMTSAPLLQSQLLKLPAHLTQQMPGNLSVAQKALQFVTSTPSVTASMVGMKSKEHIDENVAILSRPDWDLAALQKVCNLVMK